MPSVSCTGAIPPWKFLILAAMALLAVLSSSSHSSDRLPNEVAFSPAEVADKVSHAAQLTDGGYVVADRDYRARFTSRGVEFTARKSGRDLSRLLIQLAEVRCGPKIICPGDGEAKPCAVGNEIVYERKGGVVEKYEATSAGVEQSWIVRNRPGARGDLRLSCPARWEGRAKASCGGLLFGGDREAGISYGIAKVSDRLGRTLTVSPSCERGRISVLVPADFIKRAAYPVTVDPLVGPEFAIAHAYGQPAGKQEAVAVATDGSQFLVVWQDRRSGTSSDIYGARVTPSGQVLDDMGIAISVAENDQTSPRVEWNGANFLVVWTDARAWNQVADIYGCRVSPSGQALDPAGIRICGATEVQYAPDVASNGSDWFVVWEDNRSGAIDIYGTRVTANGTVVSPLGVVVAGDVSNEEGCSVARVGSNYLVVWHQYAEASTYDIYGQIMSSAGSKVGSAFAICTANGYQVCPSIAARGSEALVVWEDRRGGYYADIYGARVNSSGQVLNPGGVKLTEEPNSEELTRAVWNGSNYVLVWRDAATKLLRGRFVTSNCTPNGDSFPIINTPTGSRGPAIAMVNGICLVCYNTLSVTADVYAARIDSTRAVLDPAGFLVSKNAFDQANYAVAFDGNTYMVAWSDDRSGSSDIYVARITPDGLLLDPEGIRVTFAPTDEYDPAIAWGGGAYLIAWTDTRQMTYSGTDIFAARVTPGGQVLDATNITVCQVTESQCKPAIGWNGNKFLVAWEDMRNAVSPNYYNDIYGALVNPNGTVTAVGKAIGGATNNQFSPSVASDGSNYLVAWQDSKGTFPAIYAARVSANGTVLDLSGIQVSPISSSQMSPSAAFDGTNYLVVWSDMRGGVPDLYGVRLSAQGQRVGNEIAVSVASREQLTPSVSWDGQKYQVTWQDYRNGAGNADIYATAVTPAGVAMDTNGAQVAVSAGFERQPLVICASPDLALIVYTRYENFTNRLFGVTYNEPPPLPVATARAAKLVASGTRVSLTGKVATCSTSAMGGFFYIEEDDGNSGIKVVTSAAVSEGSRVNVVGNMTVVSGEAQITATQVTTVSSGNELPPIWSMNMQGVGGATCGLQSCTCDYRVPPKGKTRELTRNSGVNNVGMLVKVWGTVTYAAADHFYLCDGVAYDDGSKIDGIKVLTGQLTEPTLGGKVLLTAISSCYVRGGNVVRLLRPRRQSDIVVLR